MMISILPKNYKRNDPRQLLYHFPNLPIVKYAKLMQKYSFHQALAVAEDIAHKHNKILVPYSCIHWQRRQKYQDRRIKIGRNSFYMMNYSEMTQSEKAKLKSYLEDLEEEGGNNYGSNVVG